MADINNAIALDVKPPPQVTPLDLATPLSTYSQLLMAGAHSQLYGQQAQFQGARLNALSAVSSNLKAGQPIERAGLPMLAVDPEAYRAMISGQQEGNALASNRTWAQTQNPNDLAIQGAPAVAQGQNVTKQYNERLGQHAQAILASSGDGTAPIDPGIKMLELGAAVKDGSLDPNSARALISMPDQQFRSVAQAYIARGQSMPDYQRTSGNEAVRTEAGKSLGALAGPNGIPGQMPPSPFYPSGAPSGQAEPAPLPPQSTGRLNVAEVPPQRSSPPVPPAVAAAAQKADGYTPAGLDRVRQIESGDDPSAVNPMSKAAGPFQFTPATGKQYLNGKSPFDLGASADAAQRYAADNKIDLTKSLGRTPTDAELYLAHQQGAAGASKLLLNPTTPAGELVGAKAIAANGGNPNAPASAFTSMWTQRFNRQPSGALTAASMPPGALSGSPMASPAASPMSNLPLMPGAQPTMPIPAALPNVQPLPAVPAQAAPAPNAIVPPPQASPSASAQPPGAPIVAPQPSVTPAAVPAALGAPPPTGTAADQTAPLPIPQNQSYAATLAGQRTAAEEASKAAVAERIAASEARGRGMAEAQAKQYETAKEGYLTAQSGQQNLMQLQHDLAGLDNAGFLAPGPTATERLGLAKGINTAFSAAGITPLFDQNQIASAEASQKITGKLGFDLSRTLGSREAMQIVQQAISLNPGIQNSPLGSRIVAASINAGLQRQKDFYRFLTASGNAPDADIVFDRAHPVAQYVREAQNLATIPQKAMDLMQEHAGDPRAIAAFDRNFGPGMSRYFTGE